MMFLTANADPFVLKDDHIIRSIWPALQKMARSNQVIDIYDKTTWGNDESYETVLNVVHRRIAPHLNQQQRVESGVKGIADQSRTGVGEERRNARLIINFMFKREHNRLMKIKNQT